MQTLEEMTNFTKAAFAVNDLQLVVKELIRWLEYAKIPEEKQKYFESDMLWVKQVISRAEDYERRELKVDVDARRVSSSF